MPPLIAPEVSWDSAYVPSLLTRIEDYCAARWPFLAALLLVVALVGASQ